MNKSELIELAAPLCKTCNTPTQRLEQTWHRDEDGKWRAVSHLVCANHHRQIVEPFHD